MPNLEVQWLLEKSVNVLAGALVAYRLYVLGLHRTYRFFVLFVVVGAFRSAMLLPFATNGQHYYHIWVATEPLLWISCILVVFELYSLVLKRYQGIYSLSRWFFLAAVAASTIAAALTVLPAMSGAYASSYPLLLQYALIERAIFTSLAIFLLLLLALVSWFPVPLSHNLLIHCAIYSFYFFIDNVLLLYWHLGGKEAVRLANYGKFAIWIVCCSCWVFFLSRRGEERTASFGLARDAAQERRLLDQLESFNATLLRSARK